MEPMLILYNGTSVRTSREREASCSLRDRIPQQEWNRRWFVATP